MEQRNRTILLVEDDEDHTALAVRALRDNGVANHIVTMRDGEEARDYLFGIGSYASSGPGPVPELILLDLKIPKINGLDLLRRIRAHDRTRLVPVVILSSSDQEQDIATSYGLGSNSYIRKPVEFTHFVDRVRQLSMYWLLINEPPPTAAAA